jgi:OOP family OmpA-OmpF porin
VLRGISLLLAILLSEVALAQPVNGLYLNLDAGINIAGNLQSSQTTTQVNTDVGPVGVAAVGWGFGNGLRIEIEGSYRSSGIDNIYTRRINGLLEPIGDPAGSVRTYAVMTNVAYDLPVHIPGLPLRPYVGAGLGYGWLDFGNAGGDELAIIRLPQGNTYRGPVVVGFGSADALAYQAVAGVALPVRIVPGLETTLEYRFFGTTRADVSKSVVSTEAISVNGAVPAATTHNGFDLHDSTILVGLRYRFGGL